jgi:hypothetical protein
MDHAPFAARVHEMFDARLTRLLEEQP